MSVQIGEQLRQARLARTLSLEQVAQATHVRVHYLRAMEEDDFNAIPSQAQARGFLRIYAEYLGLDNTILLVSLDQLAGQVAAPDEPVTPLPAANGADTDDAARIFREIGSRLQHQRQLLGLSLEDVERHTHLRQHYLNAIENGDLKNLPSPVQGRGMLSNYAVFLGMDAEPLLLRFAEALQAQLAVRKAAVTASSTSETTTPRPRLPGPLNRIFSGELLVVFFSIIFLTAFVIWAAIRIYAMQADEQVSPTAPSIASVLLSPPTETPTSTPVAPSPTIPQVQAATPIQPQTADQTALPPGNVNSVQVYITIRQRSWLRVTVDDKIEFEGRVLSGTAYQYVGEKSVEILTGNGAGIQIFFNQQDLGPMGFAGEVVDRIFTLEGVLQPTPTLTFTPTATPRFSPTPQGTPAP